MKKENIKNILSRSVTALLVGLLVAGSTYAISPRTTHALDGGGSLALIAKEFADALAWIFGDQMIAAISNQTFEWSTEGFGNLTMTIDPGSLKPIRDFMSGDSTFLEDPGAFFSGIGDEITTYFLGELKTVVDHGLGELREGGFNQSVIDRIAIEAQAGNEAFSARLSTTLPVDQLTKFMEGNFSQQGGWDTWLELTSNPQNYFDGAIQIALGELESQKQAAINRNEAELAQSGGFLSIRQCQTLDDLGIDDPQLRMHANVDEQGCASYTNVTPGGLIGDKVKSAISADLDRIGAADEITEIIVSLFTTAIDQLVQRGFSEITSVTQNFGSPREIERQGAEQVSQVRQELYVAGNDGTGKPVPPPANPTDGTSWQGSQPNISSVSNGTYWAQIAWNAPSGVEERDIEGYIIYRFEDRSQPRFDNDGEPILGENNRQIIDPPNGTLDENEQLVVVATKSKENGSLKSAASPSDLIYVDSSLQPETQYGYVIVAFDTNNNRSSSSPESVTPRIIMTDERTQGVASVEMDIVPTLKLLRRIGEADESGNFEITLANGKKVNAAKYEVEVGSYWVPEGVIVPRFDVVFTATMSNYQVAEDHQHVFFYGQDALNNGETATIEILVPTEDSDNGVLPHVDLEVRSDASDKVREISESNNNVRLRVHFAADGNRTLPQDE